MQNDTLSVHNDVICSPKIWTNAPMEPTCAANTPTARTPWAPTAASARKGTQATASRAQVGLGGNSCVNSSQGSKACPVFQILNSF